MRYIWQHTKAITDTYKGDLPLAHFLKSYFKQYPILGSRDRKMLSAMAYSWYRCSKGIGSETTFEQATLKCLQLCGAGALWSNTKGLQTEPAALPDMPFNVLSIFPHEAELSAGIARKEWLESMLVQPDLFIRLRKNNDSCLRLLTEKQMPFTVLPGNCIALPNGTKIDEILPPDSYVVQDASSQQTGTFFKPNPGDHWYDCCSGAGGKSLLLKDMEPTVALTISDARASIIHNLQQRFKLYGHKPPATYTIDLTSEAELSKALGNKQFDNIICDAPCTGSGTWARTPEQLYFFDPGAIAQFATRQKTITKNVSKYLKPDGKLFYITCSVFRAENEDVVSSIIKNTDLTLVRSQLINGIGIKADSMFIAELRKS
jgi:16S rRNA (cytosine967-C5)-methyltransferase